MFYCSQRVTVNWGDFSIVEATLALIRQALATPDPFDRFVLLSGADYPLRSRSCIERFFESYREREFINLVMMPSEAAGKPISRLINYKSRPGDLLVKRIARRLLKKIGIIPRERDYKAAMGGLIPYAGSQWWALSREACQFIVTFVETQPRIVKFFENTQVPDEMFFQTILGNSTFKSKIHRNLTYADWSARGPSPAVIDTTHLGLFASTTSFSTDNVYGGGEMLFARKFTDSSDDVVAGLDRLIAERDG